VAITVSGTPAASGIAVDRFCQQRVSPNRTAVSGIILKGLGEAGFFVGGNVAIEYHWADGQHDRLPSLAADLVKRQVAVIAETSTPAALAAKAATTTIPIVFETGADPVKIGLVTSLNRPGGNVTAVTQTNAEITPKRLQLLHELRPTAKVIVLLVNRTDPADAEANTRDVQAAADSLGLQLMVGKRPIGDAMNCATRALAVDPGCSEAYIVIAYVYTFQRRHDDAVAAGERAIALIKQRGGLSHGGHVSDTLVISERPPSTRSRRSG
jgi:putative ABC transport system substrate-binding protein